MTSHRLLLSLSTLVAALALGAACATEDKPRSVPPPGGAPGEVRALIGDAACRSDAQCDTIGVGAKACGGPAAYLAWSSWRTDGAALRSAAERAAQVQRDTSAASGRMSDCAVTADPGAYCDAQPGSAGVCRLRARTGGTPPVAR